jgi:spore germination cell wall hydrolase CwlJ-like protein
LSRIVDEFLHTLGAGGVLVMAAAMNFALYPDALAAVVSGERAIIGFVPDEPSLNAGPDAPVELDQGEVRLLAATAWAEARSEGEEGMRAVAHVIVNRVGQRFGEDVETVILAPKQFSAWNLGDPNRPLAQNPEQYATGGANLETWEIAQRVAREVLSGQSADPTEGALFYHTRAIRPWWSRYGEGRREIGAHVFYRDVPDRQDAPRARVTQVADTTPRPIEPEAGNASSSVSAAQHESAAHEGNGPVDAIATNAE